MELEIVLLTRFSKIFKDSKNHASTEGKGLLQMQGKVVDGKYINQVFVTAMNNPVMEVLRKFASTDHKEIIFDLF